MPSIRRECRFNAKGSFAAGQGFGNVDVAGPAAFVCVQDVKLGENEHRRIRVVGADARELVPPGVVDAHADVVRIRLQRRNSRPIKLVCSSVMLCSHILLPRSKAAFMNFVFFTAPGS